MIISIQGTSLIEYPGKVASVLFSAGCNLACPFCHNPELVNVGLLDRELCLTHDRIIDELNERAGFIDAVELTGGEPLLYEENIDLLRRLKDETSLSVKLDTNGTYPDRLAQVLDFVDYVAMDLKSSPQKYPAATGGKTNFMSVKSSALLLMNQKRVSYEFRSTMVPGYITSEDVIELVNEFHPSRIKRYTLQNFHSENTLSTELRGLPSYPKEYLEKLATLLSGLVDDVQLRF